MKHRHPVKEGNADIPSLLFFVPYPYFRKTGKVEITKSKIVPYFRNLPKTEITEKTCPFCLGLSCNTVMSAFARFVALGIRKETTEKERNRRFAYVQYLEILKEGI